MKKVISPFGPNFSRCILSSISRSRTTIASKYMFRLRRYDVCSYELQQYFAAHDAAPNTVVSLVLVSIIDTFTDAYE